jgi:tetratricopeptide (TPR) repeat protein
MKQQTRGSRTVQIEKASAMDSLKPAMRSRADERRKAFFFRLVLIVCTMICMASPRLALPQAPAEVILQGRVLDSAGLPVADATVRLTRRTGPQASETKSAEDGTFSFSGLGAGTYLLLAEKAKRRSSEIVVVATAAGMQSTADIVLGDEKRAEVPAKPASNPGMEFSDQPTFTVAGVTDWTAAGGHGSDATLRTSESLNREALSLKPNAPNKSGKTAEADVAKNTEIKLTAALASAPESFDANHELGTFYLDHGRYSEAAPLLQKAFRIDSSQARNELDLARACEELGDIAAAREHIEHLLDSGANAETHRVAGEIYERTSQPLLAVREFERAVRLDPSEQNYFAWGTELLYHRAVWQAKEVFENGVKAYPRSPRLLTSLGAVLFAGALYDEAEVRLCEASDLDPESPETYLFMGKIEIAAPHSLECADTRLARYAQVHPENALANYFYAMAVWKQHGSALDAATRQEVEALLKKAVTIDPGCSDGYLQLGNLSSSQNDFARAVEFYTKALAANPQSSDAHYRLGVAYDRIGERAKAERELALHDKIEKEQAAEVERQRKEIKQFVVSVPGKPDASSAQ